MGNVCVITGGGSGMGLEAAKILGKTVKSFWLGELFPSWTKPLPS